MIRGLCALLTAAVLSVFAYLLVTGQYYKEGPTLVHLSAEHGIHRGDLFIACAWLVGVIALLVMMIPDPRESAPVEDVRARVR